MRPRTPELLLLSLLCASAGHSQSGSPAPMQPLKTRDPRLEKISAAMKQSPDDPALLSALAYSEQKRKATVEARELYEKALKIDPTSIDAAVNLGVIEAQQDHLAPALRLWQEAFKRAPYRSSIGMNIARADCAREDFAAAKASVSRVLEFNPDFGPAREMLRHLAMSPVKCDP